MTDIFEWKKVSSEDREKISAFVSANAALVNEVMRKNYPDIYIGRRPDEIVRGWLAVDGLKAVLEFIDNEN